MRVGLLKEFLYPAFMDRDAGNCWMSAWSMSGSGSVGFSEVKTDVNWWFRMSAFTLASLCATPSRFSGATPQA